MQTPHEAIRILGPAPAPIAKLRGKFRFHLLMIGQHGDPMRELVSQVCARLNFSSDVQFAIDVDPSDML
jgi:primosomal protein N' (replication factor Y)